ncbi:rhamnulokinase [Leucobacter luti]|uniref:Rhamnulokinase n=1 Tax=Leucobacter luti TaxID=340320 RepID=A0A4Q7U2G1_9MICO|nr:FGGY-family carbohydrate kinase [Leucobacter luti]MBL3699330.1 rhamnulokinase [Leucobacter luti]RZT66840.1 rhamnulokinase [Leucobacter luti]
MAAPTAPRAYAAVDLGASSGRVVLGARRGAAWEFEEVHRFTNEVVDTHRGDAWDLERLFAETLTGLARAVARCAARGEQLAGIGVDSWGVDWVLRAPDGEIELPGRSYRGAPDPAPAIAARGLSGVSSAEAFAVTGVPDQAINTALRLADEAGQRTFSGEQLLFIPDLWLFWLTGVVGTDPTIASTSQLFAAHAGAFSAPLAAAHGLAGFRLPPVAPVASLVGALAPELRERIGAATEVPVYRVAGHDTAAAFAFAEPVAGGATEALISSGTWSLVGGALPEPVTTPEAAALGFTNERGASGTLLLRNLTGLWMLQECLREWGAGTQERDALLAEVESAPFDARTFDTSAPELLHAGDMEARVRRLCAAAGRPLAESRASVVHAIIDSLAVAYAAGVDAFARLSGASVDRIRIVGGGSRNARLCRLTAELARLPVLAGPTEASAIGNVALQALASGEVAHAQDVFAAIDPAHTRHFQYPNTDQARDAEEPQQ